MAKLTIFGANALAAAAVGGTKIPLTKLKLGNGNGSVPVFDGSESSLVHQVTEVSITAVYRRIDSPNFIFIDAEVPFNNGGYWIREAAATDDAGNVYVIGPYAAIEKPAPTDPNARAITVRLIAQVSPANITAIALFNTGGSSGAVISTTGGLPVGTVVDNYLGVNDPSYADWVKLGPNVSADITMYPKLANISSQGPMTFAAVAGSNLPTLLTGVAGSWGIIQWRIKNGIHIAVARDSSKIFFRTFTSSDGITYVEKGNASRASGATVGQVNIYYLNSKYYLLSADGVWESSDACATWTLKTSNYYYSMDYYNGLYVFGDSNSVISTSADLVTYTARYTTPLTGPIVNFKSFKGNIFAFQFASGNQYKIHYSANGTSGWTTVTITAYTHGSTPLGYVHGEVFNNKLVLIGDTATVTLQSDDGIAGWAKLPDFSSNSSGWEAGTIVVNDTIYGNLVYSTDLTKAARVSTGNSGAAFCSDGVNVFYGGIGATDVILYKFPVANNANKVYLPNLPNKMMRIIA